jgi:hypothetical protein
MTSPFLWHEEERPSIFALDPHFRNRHKGLIDETTGLGYKQFGTYSKAGYIPNKHEGVLTHASTKTTR